MAQSKSTYLRNLVYNLIFRATNATAPTTVYMSLHTGAPGLVGSNEVPSTNAYVRQAIAWGAPTGGAGANSGVVTFPAPTPANWGTLTHFGYWDAATGGNYLGGDAFANSIATSIGVPVSVPVGNQTWAEL